MVQIREADFKRSALFIFFRRWYFISKEWRINEGIRVKEVRLIAEDGEQLGIFPIQEAYQIAEERDLDLVEISPAAHPPVCRLMDYGKFRFEQNKREKETRKKQKVISIKEVKMRPNIEDHDFFVKAKGGRKFLEGGDKVKVTIMFRGREITHPQLGEALCKRLGEELADISTMERPPKLEGKNMIMILAPKKDHESGSKKNKEKNPNQENE